MNIIYTGGTKTREYNRSAEFFEQLAHKQGIYFALAMLVDSQYGRKDFIEVLNRLEKSTTAKQPLTPKEVTG